ncbi:SUMF1/EgtB/PvdO family nonheme iron enzyme [Ectopseudomonas mendocina]|uniref:SUMF1/EgtB/PvdO family nonheme iron enzyme n=1 Tax=Ectopseudomonas mendocina TaxID=300 RepID=A0ABZ2RH60_ECTME
MLTACSPSEPPLEVALLAIPASTVSYQLPGSPATYDEHVAAFSIMQRQVSQAEDLPATGLSWLDAQAYAAWLSHQTGQFFRLPDYPEWVAAAGEAFVQDQAIVDNLANPAQRWLQEYEQEARRGPLSKTLLTFAEQERNNAGLLNISGNVWEWTQTCFGQSPGLSAGEGFCGVRIAAGRHASALSDFVRDPIAGACSVGTPPAHLGLRLVVEN